jgi:hypothetical protein
MHTVACKISSLRHDMAQYEDADKSGKAHGFFDVL